MLAAACGGDDVPPTFTRGAPTATTAPTAASPTEPPAATPITAPADTVAPPAGGVSLKISVNGDALAFDMSNFEVAAGAEVTLVLDNVSTINQHNWVLVQNGTKDDVAVRGTTNPTSGWIQPDDPDVIAKTKLLNAGETGEAGFAAPSPGTYQFVCTFPGHNATMFGDFVVTP